MELLRRRMRAHWLADRPGRTVESVVAHAVGIPAQDTAAARLAVRARSHGTTADEVRRAARERSVVRTWLMRGTLHLVTAEDVRWLLALFGARNAASGAGRRRQLGLDDDTCARALAALPGVLRTAGLAGGSALSRADLVDRLAREGVRIDPTGQAPAHLVGYAAARGVICRGPDLDGDEPGYVLLDDWVPPGSVPDEEEALAELARRYLAAYGPASPEDLAAWSGLSLDRARRGFALAAVPDAPEAPATMEPSVRLLGAFDPYLLGYRTREPALDPRHAARVQAGGGIIHPVVVVDGRVVGTWRLRRTRNQATLEIDPFGPLGPMPELTAEAFDVGRFLGLDVAPAAAVNG